MRILSRIFALVLSLALLLAAVSCDNSAKDVGSNDALDQVTYPLISYLPHYNTLFDDRWVSVRFDTVEELNSARDALRANGVEISAEKRVAFDYRSDDLVVKYWFDGILTLESSKLAGEKDYYELDYSLANIESYIYFNVSSPEGLPERAFLYGPHSYTYPYDMFGYAHSRVTVAEGADIPEKIDTDKLVIDIAEKNEPQKLSEPILHKVSYEGKEIINIYSTVYWTDELFEKIRDSLITY